MKRYLLDNAVLVAYLKGRPGATQLIRPWVLARDVATSLVIYGEANDYIKDDLDDVRRKGDVRTLLREVTPLRLTYDILERYTDLRRAMRKPYGTGLVGGVDTLIAAAAIEHRLLG